MPTVTVPCAAITGAEDQYAPPNAVREFVARLPAPCPVEIIEGAAHLPFLEQPDAFAEAVRRVLSVFDRTHADTRRAELQFGLRPSPTLTPN